MFAISMRDDGEILLSGRFDASQVETANAVFDRLTSTTRLNFQNLDYISSAGLGALLRTQKRLADTHHSLVLTKMNKLVRDIFKIARFDLVFQIED